jgi:hypothetical protein
MIEPVRSDLLCTKCNARMRFSCQEIEKPGFVHDVFECTRCRSTQSYVTRSGHLDWKRTGGALKTEDHLEETCGPKQKGNSLVNAVRKLIGDPTKVWGLLNSHRKTRFLFL